MILTIPERLVLIGVLPAEGNMVTLRVITDLRDALTISEKEATEVGLVQDGQQITWKPGTDLEAQIEVTPAGKGLIVEQLKRLNDEQKLTANHMTLYEKFVEQHE